LVGPEHDVTPGAPRSHYSCLPKVTSALELIRQALERREQVMPESALLGSV
jgi:hypothetical protein